MRIVSTSYSKTDEFTHPQKWLERISFYTGLLEELGKEHEVISIERINYEGELEQNRVHYHFIKLKNKVTRFPFKMHRFIKKMKPDVVFVNGFIFPLQIIQLRWKLGKKTRIIVLHRSEKPSKELNKWLQKIADKKVDAYLFSSNEFAKDWRDIIDEQKMHEVIQASSSFQPGDKNIARESLSIKGSTVLLWVGRLDQNKDPLTLIKAFKQFQQDQPQAVLYIIYQSDELINECRELIGANENIRLVGKVEHDQLENWYGAADFFISSSHYEGNGIAALEAMSCGCVPVLSSINSFRRMTGPGKCGLLFEPGNVSGLLQALKKANELDREAEKEKVLQQFREELSFEAVARKINRVITIVKNG
ncbi:MAG: glycosyltransferase family 4 protein [Chitinophagaceae bacterium]|nr:glycosyltransferase family 4 protein [Chitinophagaceae bacterium]